MSLANSVMYPTEYQDQYSPLSKSPEDSLIVCKSRTRYTLGSRPMPRWPGRQEVLMSGHDQLPPPPPSAPDAVRQQAGDLNLAATPQRPPDRPPAPRARPAGRPPPQIGTARLSWGRRQRGRLKWPLIVAIVAMLAAAGHAGSLLQANPPGSQTPTAQPAPPPGQTARPAPPGGQTVLPFAFLGSPDGVAVDSVGNVYAAATAKGRVWELAPGSTGPTELPFTSLRNPSGVAVDAAGTVYVTDGANRVLKLAAGSSSPTALPFTDLNNPDGVAVDTAGNLYVV